MKAISLESKKYSFLIYIGVGLIIFNIIRITISNSQAFSINIENETFNIFDVIIVFLAVGCSVLAGIIAYRLNRNVIFWTILSFFFAPISFIILGTLQVYLEPEQRKIFHKYQSEYFASELNLTKNWHKKKINRATYDEKLAELLHSLDNKMNEELQNQKSNDFVREVVRKIEGEGHYLKIKDTCPACNAQLSETDMECPECGLNMQ